jgi:hypothetical protein
VTALSIPELPPGTDNVTGALAYAAKGWYLLPVDPETKHPGSIVGKGWPAQSSRDPEQIVAWFAGRNDAIALHVGRSGAVAFDVDDPTAVPELLREQFRAHRPPFQSTREAVPGRGHYLFGMPEGRDIGNSLGKLEKGWGEIRGRNGVVVVAPSVHTKPGGRYVWLRSGALPTLPEELAALLPDALSSDDAASDAEVRQFLAEHACDEHPTLLRAPLAKYRTDTGRGASRHETAVACVVWAFKEAAAGLYPAQRAYEGLKELHVAACADPKHPEGQRPPSDWPGIVAWAVAQARASDLDGVRGLADAAVERRASLAGDPFSGTNAASSDNPADAAGADAGEAPESASEASWLPVDLTAYLNGSYVPVEPTLLRRSDGVALLYPGLVHSFHGESESGKSLLLQIEAARLVTEGEDVLFIDFESDAASVGHRLVTFGAPVDAVLKHFHYVRPQSNPNANLDERQAFGALLEQRYALAVVDGVTDSLTIFNLKTKENDDITAWMRSFPRRIADRTGAAVALVDHVTKDSDTRGRFAIGGQAKMNGLTGAAYTVAIAQPLGRDMRGEIVLRVAKDRVGWVRSRCGTPGKDRTQEAARIVVDSRGTVPVVSINPPRESGSESGGPAGFRPTVLMQRAADFIERNPGQSGNTVVKGAGGNREMLKRALEVLVGEGFVRRENGPNNSQLHYSVRPYRRAIDPLDEDYSEPGTTQPLPAGGSGSSPYTGELGTTTQPVLGTTSEPPGTTTLSDPFSTPRQGPRCARCGGPQVDPYGVGGNRLCSSCRTATTAVHS